MPQTILVADDEESIVEVVSIYLQYNGYNTIEAYNAKTTLELVEKKPDLIILDVWFGDTDGTTLCRKIKSQENTRNIPILMFSAARNLKSYTLEAGADDYIEKPFDISTLLKKVQNLLKQ